MWTSEQQNAITHYVIGKISRDQLLTALSLELSQVPGEFRRQLRLAIDNRDSDLAEVALLVASGFEIPAATYTDLTCLLLVEDWHNQHENLIGNMQEAAEPQTVPIISKAIDLKPRLEYLDYDDYGSYYKKCLWALQAIGTPEAIAVIEDCSRSQDTALQEQAAYRLSKITASRR